MKADKRRLYLIMSIVCVLVLFLGIITLVKMISDSFRGQSEYETIKQEVLEETLTQMQEIEVVTEAVKEIFIPELEVDFGKLAETNEDIYAYIYIPNTNVSYPVLQHPKDDVYYLEHNMDHTKGYPGCIYTEKCNSREFDDRVTLVYGHNMKNGSMFATLHNFEDGDFFEENRYIYIYMPDGAVAYEIFAAVTYGDEHIMMSYDFDDEDKFDEFINKLYNCNDKGAHYAEDVEAVYGDRVIVLSTCCDNPSKRFLVCGKRID